MRKITKHIVHCSDSATGDVAQIRQWHLARGWRNVGYHFVIRPDGEVECGRFVDEAGAHCRGQNQQSIGTCLIGIKRFSPEQFAALFDLHESLKVQFPSIALHQHFDFNAHKSCPNFNVHKVMRNIAAENEGKEIFYA